MAYSAPDHQTRINFFSNPDIIYNQTNTPMGTITSNNARVLLLNRFRMAAVGDESSRSCHVADEAFDGDSIGFAVPEDLLDEQNSVEAGDYVEEEEDYNSEELDELDEEYDQ
jgi:hypothetical protein